MSVDPDPECDEEGWGEARSTAVAVAVTTAAVGVYVLAHGVEQYFTYTDALGAYGVLLQFGVIAGVGLAHEGVHAVAYRTVCGLPWADIEGEFALFPAETYEPVHWSVHPARPVRRGAYTAAVVAPTVVLGVVPVAVALATGYALAMFVGTVGLLLVGTDVGTLVALWRHPDRVGAAEPAV